MELNANNSLPSTPQQNNCRSLMETTIEETVSAFLEEKKNAQLDPKLVHSFAEVFTQTLEHSLKATEAGTPGRTPIVAHSVKKLEDKIHELQKENFNLRLRRYLATEFASKLEAPAQDLSDNTNNEIERLQQCLKASGTKYEAKISALEAQVQHLKAKQRGDNENLSQLRIELGQAAETISHLNAELIEKEAEINALQLKASGSGEKPNDTAEQTLKDSSLTYYKKEWADLACELQETKDELNKQMRIKKHACRTIQRLFKVIVQLQKERNQVKSTPGLVEKHDSAKLHKEYVAACGMLMDRLEELAGFLTTLLGRSEILSILHIEETHAMKSALNNSTKITKNVSLMLSHSCSELSLLNASPTAHNLAAAPPEANVVSNQEVSGAEQFSFQQRTRATREQDERIVKLKRDLIETENLYYEEQLKAAGQSSEILDLRNLNDLLNVKLEMSKKEMQDLLAETKRWHRVAIAAEIEVNNFHELLYELEKSLDNALVHLTKTDQVLTTRLNEIEARLAETIEKYRQLLAHNDELQEQCKNTTAARSISDSVENVQNLKIELCSNQRAANELRRQLEANNSNTLNAIATLTGFLNGQQASNEVVDAQRLANTSPDLGIECDLRAPEDEKIPVATVNAVESKHDCAKIEREKDDLRRKLLWTKRTLWDAYEKLRTVKQQETRIEDEICEEIMKTHKVLHGARASQNKCEKQIS